MSPTPQPDESALVLAVAEAEPWVAETRARFDRSALRGMPAHVTVLYPFRHPDAARELSLAVERADRWAIVRGFPLG